MPAGTIPPQRSVVSRIVIVDDAEEVSDLRLWLKAKGYEIHVARDAGQARSLVNTRRPDFVFTETLLPQETGFELCSFLKRQNECLPVVMLTEIDLDAARNLAIWCGADGYVTKPCDFPSLERMISEIADAVWLRTHMSAQMSGRIEFECGCGKRLAIRHENAGKAVRCPKCAKMVITPKFSTTHSGTWKRAEADDGSSDDQRRSNLFCGRCGHLVNLLQHSRHDHAKCDNCGHTQNVPRWLLDHRRFFFQPPPPEALQEFTIRRRLQQFLVIACPACAKRYPLNPQQPDLACRCPGCGVVNERPSLRNSPLAKAALASTGRLFAIAAGRVKNRKFLLPEHQEIMIGTDECCSLRFSERQVAPFHCALWWSEDGPWVKPLSEEGVTEVNREIIIAPTLLQPGDVVTVGSVRLVLMGSRHLDLHLDDVRTVSTNTEETISVRDARIARQAAVVLQLHWERQRAWLKDHPDWIVDDRPSVNHPVADDSARHRPGATATPDYRALLPTFDPTSARETHRINTNSSRLLKRVEAPPPLKLPAPESCGLAEPTEANKPENPVSFRDLKKQQAERPADQAAQIISGIFQRPPQAK